MDAVSKVQETNDEALACRAALDARRLLDDGHVQLFRQGHRPVSPLMLRGTFVRTLAIDAAAARAVSDCCQVLVLGAGFDTRWQRVFMSNARVRLYVEVDVPEVVAAKRHALSRPHDCHGAHTRNGYGKSLCSCIADKRYRLVPWDLEDATPAQLPADWSADAPTVIIAECVLMYLSHGAVKRVFEYLASRCGNADVVVFDPMLTDDRFSRTMAENFEARGIPIYSHPALCDIVSAFSIVSSSDFEQIAASLTAQQKAVLSRDLVMDEYEEWRLFSAHYRLSVYRKRV